MSTIERALIARTRPVARSTSNDEAQFEDGGTHYRMNGSPERAASAPHCNPVQEEKPGIGRPEIDIPFARLQVAGFLTPGDPRSIAAEEFRSIKRPLLQNITSAAALHISNANLIMVTSALEGDGKTFCSLNLAMSIAMEQDKSVLYIDADVHKATAGKVLGVPHDTPGLIDILMGRVRNPEDAILRTSMSKLSVLPAGTAHTNATELLAGRNMHHLMARLSTSYADRVIVFDSPPLLLTTESRVLASLMGQIVFVAAANITPQHAVREALEDLGKDILVTVMLNKVPRNRFSILGIGHNYGYGYGYGQSYRQDVYASAAGESTP